MAGLKGRMKRVQREATTEGVVITLRDGSTRAFTVMDVQKEMFLAKYALAREEARQSPVLEAVRQATPESRAAFEAQHGTITPSLHIVAPEKRGGWVEVYRMEEDGTVSKVRYEGEEAARLREEVLTAGPAF